MEFPLRYVWFSSLFLILGGGGTVVNVCLTMILTDSTPAASRSRVFLFFTASNLGSEVIAPPIASYFIDSSSNHSNPWIPLLIGLFCTGITLLLAACSPETLIRRQKYSKIGDDSASGDVPDQGELEEDISFKSTLKHTLQSLQYISTQRVLLLLVCVFMISDFARQSMIFLIQYVSVRYRLTLGQVRKTARVESHLLMRNAGQLSTFLESHCSNNFKRTCSASHGQTAASQAEHATSQERLDTSACIHLSLYSRLSGTGTGADRVDCHFW